MVIILITIPVIIASMLFVYSHMTLAHLLVFQKVKEQLRTWLPADGVVISVTRPDPAGVRNPWTVTYEFESRDGTKQQGKSFFPQAASYKAGDTVKLLYDPENPSLCRLENEMRPCGVLEPREFCVKSEKQVRTEMTFNGCICLAFLIASLAGDLFLSASKGALLLIYIVLCILFMGVGVSQMKKFFPGKLKVS